MNLTRFGFTLKDDGLVGSSRFTEPLGIQPIWSHFGRAIVPNFTEQTGNAYGFFLLVYILFYYEEYCEWIEKYQESKRMSVEQFYILAEQIFAYSYYENEHQWNLPGKRNLEYYYTNKDDPYTIKVGLKRELLGSQLSGGTWGIYRGAAIRSKIIDGQGRRLSPEFLNDLYVDSIKLERRHYNELFNIIQYAYDNKNEGAELKLKKTLCRQLHGVLSKPSKNKGVFRKYLIDQFLTDEVPLMKLTAEYFLQANVLITEYRQHISSCRNISKKHAYLFTDIIYCEDYIATLQSVIQFLYSQRGRKISETCQKLPLDLNKLEGAYSNFKNISNIPKSGIAAGRYKQFIDNFTVTSKMDFVDWLLNLHNKIITERSGSPWIELVNDVITINVEYPSNENLIVVPGKGWSNPYYFNTLASVYKGLK